MRRTRGLYRRVIGGCRLQAAARRPIIDRTADKATATSGLRDNVAAKPGESQKPIMTTAPTAASNPICLAYGLIENILADQKSGGPPKIISVSRPVACSQGF
jgi:hypothetical protein